LQHPNCLHFVSELAHGKLYSRWRPPKIIPMSAANSFPNPSHTSLKPGEPVWDLALLFPFQGGWTVENYLGLEGGALIEYTDGFIRVLPMPTLLHQWIVRFLFRKLDAFVGNLGLGEVFLAPLPVELSSTKFREPDLVFVRPQRIKKWNGYPVGADLVIEVVSEGQANWHRDYVEKRAEYAVAAIAEYWIVDPQLKTVTVLVLSGNEYREHGIFRDDDTLTSALLDGFACQVAEIFAKCSDVEG
jgi:Uma2 family endonuclease